MCVRERERERERKREKERDWIRGTDPAQNTLPGA